MISIGELAEHLWALLVILVGVCAAGYPLSMLMSGRNRWAAAPLLGCAYWAAALYVLPFRGGLLVASGIVAAAFALTVWTQARKSRKPKKKKRHLAFVILLLGAAVYLTPLATQHVPPGMDGSRYATNAQLIAAQAGLPKTNAPFAPDVPLGASNHGLAALASLAVMCGASPVSAVIATVPVVFGCLLISLFLLLRQVTTPAAAAVIAVACTWATQSLQKTFSWGGFSGVLALAVGLLAVKLLMDTIRTGQFRPAILLGLSAASLPLIHGLVAAGWLYIAVPTAIVPALLSPQGSASLKRKLAAVSISTITGAAILAMFFVAGQPQLDEAAQQWIRTNALDSAFEGSGPGLLTAVPIYIAHGLGWMSAGLLSLGLLTLAILRRFKPLAISMAGLALIAIVLANAKYRILPGSLLLYPDRIQYFAMPLAAVVLALAWSNRPWKIKLGGQVALAISAVLLVATWFQHVQHFQKTAVENRISEDVWSALQWSASNLDGSHDYVGNLYGTGGAYLPAVAGVAATDWHVHIAEQSAANNAMRQQRTITHVLFIDRETIVDKIGQHNFDIRAGELQSMIDKPGTEKLFSNEHVSIYRLCDK